MQLLSIWTALTLQEQESSLKGNAHEPLVLTIPPHLRGQFQPPLAPKSLDQTFDVDKWQYSDTPAFTTEADEAWAEKYSMSVKEMAKCKLFRRKVVLRRSRRSKENDE